MYFLLVCETIEKLLKDNKLIYCENGIPNDTRLDGHIFCVQNKIIIIVSGTCGDIDDINIYIINNSDINFMTKSNMYLFADGPITGGSCINGVLTINYSSIEDKDLYEKMKLSTHNYYSSGDIFNDDDLQKVINELNKCLIEQGLMNLLV
jgi:hypothetical protein